MNLWRSATALLDWFKNINNNGQHSFIIFDIVNFYPSIKAALLNAALDFASEYKEITTSERNIILQA